MAISRRALGIYGAAIFISIALVALSAIGIATNHNLHNQSPTTHNVSQPTISTEARNVSEPRRCSVKRVFRVLFSQLVTVCVDLQDSLIYVGIDPYSSGTGGIWFDLDEWNNFLRQLSLIKIVIADFHKYD